MAEREKFNLPQEEDVFVFPASFAQQRLWFFDQLIPGNCFYNIPYLVRLVGFLNLTALEQTINKIVLRHEALRTTFEMVEGQIVQVIAPSLSIPLPVVDLRSLPTASRETEAKRLATAEFKRPFHLTQAPLLRLKLFQLDDTEYLLLLCMHHIVSDDWSMGVLIQELGTLYTAKSCGQPSPLPELPLQYADFAHWQREWLQGEVLETQLAYWRQQLHNISVLNLPTDRQKPAVSSYRGATQTLELPQKLTEELKALSKANGVTLFMTLLAAFKTLLYRYTHQEDIAIGSPIANRNRKEIEGLIGFFVNNLVLRTDLSGNPTFQELLGRVRELTLEAYSHQDLPFEKLVEGLPERNLNSHPLFQVVFNLQNAPMSALEMSGLALSAVDFDSQTTRFDLEFHLWECSENFRSLLGEGWEHSQGIRAVMVYSTDLFDESTISRMLKHFYTLLEGIVANPEQRLSQLPILTDSERQQLLYDWNDTQQENVGNCTGLTHTGIYRGNHRGIAPTNPLYTEAVRKSCCIHHLFESQVEKYPDAIAVSFENQQLTYRELNNRANQLAHYLHKIGVSAEVLVGICMERSVETIVGMLGILKAGGAYLPLDPSYPPDRIKFMLEDAKVSVLLTQQQLSSRGLHQARVICLDTHWEEIAQESEKNPTNDLTGDNLAYVIYTSGSTGKPKGVAIPHQAVTHLVCNTNYIQLDSSDKIAQISNTSFDAATFEIWSAMLNGSQLVVISRDVILSPQDLASQIRKSGISVLFLITALFQQVAKIAPEAFDSLRYLLFGGETADVKVVAKLIESNPLQELLNFYGPCEYTTFTSWYRVEKESLKGTSLIIPIGRPIQNTQIYLLDGQLQPVPIGVTGELYISGNGLARGYLNRPELTAERFMPNPFSQEPGSRLYKTGDLARYLPDGNIQFLGRIDEQVKIRGFRIELGEIEAVLLEHPAVRDTVVITREDATGNNQLIAYVVPNHSQAEPGMERELRQYLKQKLPEYAIPAAYVVMKALPLTPNGKIDRRALPKIDTTNTDMGEDYVAPSTPIEEVLVKIWTEVLGRHQVSVHDNFFEVGGHSLLATQLNSRIRDAFQVELPLRKLFESPTVASLAEYIETVSWAVKGADNTKYTIAQREEAEF